MSIWKAALLSALIPVAALPALAQDAEVIAPTEQPRAERLFQMFDFDGDGTVTRAEVENAPELRFQAADADGNGVLDRAELVAQGTARAEARIAARVEAGVDQMIDRADADGDGVLGAEEMANARPDRGDVGPRGMRGAWGDRAERGQVAGRGGMPDPARLFDMVDADDDGVVSEAEFTAAMEQMMQRRDGGRRGWGHRG
ncbi:EF hand domain protein [Roseibacterium elongatum DSM 19469]|uniref:EF hand domain protein n=1 Tax=Roseicyclus elongatus DSM 19469 TaxID=1294273 RepID=W8RND5_9RHOB|nr:EF-hand domain-containing protein [Roseibacterium elongatum]AHM02508.1 EF hand domain protein [Roseibacterium elongatum DSM 19469]